MSEQQIKEMVVTNIIDNCTIGLDNTGQDRYSLNEQQFGKCVDALVKSINVIQCCKSDSEQLVCEKCNGTGGYSYTDNIGFNYNTCECQTN